MTFLLCLDDDGVMTSDDDDSEYRKKFDNDRLVELSFKRIQRL